MNINNKARRLMLLLLIVGLGISGVAQNVNRPNKRGPLGTQVNTYSGNFFLPRNDIYIPARGFNIAVSFYYNSFSFDDRNGFGNGWNMSYCIKYKNDTANAKKIIWGEGREDLYAALPGGAFRSPKGFFNTFTQYQPNKYLLTELDGTKYFFDNSVHKKITRMEEPNGNYINFNYTDSLLTSLLHSSGQSISFTYNATGKLASVVDAVATPSRTFVYTYDAAGNLVQVTDPLGGTKKYSYLVNGPMKTMADKNSNVVDIIYYNDFSVRELIGCNKHVSFSYDSASNMTVVTDHMSGGANQVTRYKYQTLDGVSWLSSMSGNCCGFNMNFEFDVNGNKTKETDANGNVTSYTYDNKGNVITAIDALNQKVTFTYSNDFNNITSYTDAKGNMTTLVYNSTGNLTQMIEPGNLISTATYNSQGDITSSTDPKGNVFTYNYDSYGYPVSVSGPNSYSATLGIDARGNLLSYADARGNTSTLEYDILNRLKKLTDPINNSLKLNYDPEGNITSLINKNNEASQLEYDASNRLVRFTNTMTNKTYFGYDAMDNPTMLKNSMGHATNFTYDARNRLSAMKDALGNTSSMNYDAKGNVLSISLPNGQKINYTYDALDRITAVNDINGPIVSVAYDKNGNIISATNGTGATSTATYDNLDRIKDITDPLGNTTLLTHDNNGNVTSVTDRNGLVKTYTYDSLDRVKTFTDHMGYVTTISYDVAGNPVSIKDQNNNTSTHTFDNLNRVKRTTYPDGKFIEYSYDRKGNVVAKKLTDGTTINYDYDSLNRIVSKILPGGQTSSFAYDVLGRIVSATNNAGTVNITYDALNRIISESFDGRTTRYSYDLAGRKQTTIYPDSTIIYKTYDTRNRLTSIAKGNTSLVSYQYNNVDQVTTKIFANGIRTNLQYDFASRLSNYSTGSGTIQNTSYTYDKEGNKKTINRLNNPSLSEEFNYDNNYRVINYKRGVIGGATTLMNTYSYDAVGNRTAANLNGTPNTYTSNNLNQLSSNNNGSQNTIYSYDNNGNLIYDGNFYKTYDADGKLLKDSAGTSNIVAYEYDAFGRRVQKLFNGAPLKYTYAGLAQIEERDGITNSLRSRTIFKNFITPVANEKNDISFYYHQNELNSIEAITNSAGTLTERYQYDVYGKQTIYDASNVAIPGSLAGNRFGFTGQQFDSATNSLHFHFRNYNPGIGTFNQRDLIGYADGTGMYQYVHNNPANGIDLFGLEDCPPERENLDRTERQEGWVNGIGSWTETLLKLKAYYETAKMIEELRHVEEVLDRLQDLGSLDEAEKFAENWLKTADQLEAFKDGKLNTAIKGLGKLGFALNVVDLGIKSAKFGSDIASYQNGEISGEALTKSGGNLAQSGLGFTPVGALYNLFDFAQEKLITGRSMNDNAELAGQVWGENSVNTEQEEEEAEWHRQNGTFDKWFKIRKEQNIREARKKRNPGCPQNQNPGGNQSNKPKGPGTAGSTTVDQSFDPNEIIGPEGVPSKHWVSVNDRMPYTILYENDKIASAPAKFVRIISPIEPKQDPATFQLGSFGFNTQTFTIPPNTASYYQRLNCIDSLGLYVDVTAGYDQINNQAFWEFQAIDPLTLLPPPAPSVGFLLLQDSSKPLHGHGFVNFSIKPRQTAITLDTIGARASIVFDLNPQIPTNIAKNTIDAFPPVSHITSTGSLVFVDTTTVKISWNAQDDLNGVGVKKYSLYVSVNGGQYNLYKDELKDTSINFKAIRDTTYCFFTVAFDSVGNMEPLKNSCDLSVKVNSGGPLPLTWLYFNGSKKDRHALLKWATGSEINTRNFVIERSFNGSTFTSIGSVNAIGNSSVTHDYSFVDSNALELPASILYYRLKQVDRDGKFSYSIVVSIRLEQNNTEPVISAYPNPFSESITLKVSSTNRSDKTTSIELFSIQGKILYSRKMDQAGSSTTLINDLPFLPAGIYILKAIVNDKQYSFKITKQ